MVSTTLATSPTQALRDLITDLRWGMAGPEELDNALLELENLLHLPLTNTKEE